MVCGIELRESIIKAYVDAYNRFDVEGMLANCDPDIRFENVSNGKTNMSIQGLMNLRTQAEEAKKLFSTRHQTIRSIKHLDDCSEIEIEYNAILSVDLPDGMKKGDALHLTGRSIFRFSHSRIIGLTDIS